MRVCEIRQHTVWEVMGLLAKQTAISPTPRATNKLDFLFLSSYLSMITTQVFSANFAMCMHCVFPKRWIGLDGLFLSCLILYNSNNSALPYLTLHYCNSIVRRYVSG